MRLAKRQLEINPDDSYSLSTMMIAAASVGDMETYQTVKRKMLEEWASDPQVQYDFAISASRLGEMEAGREYARNALELGYPVAFLNSDPDISLTGVEF